MVEGEQEKVDWKQQLYEEQTKRLHEIQYDLESLAGKMERLSLMVEGHDKDDFNESMYYHKFYAYMQSFNALYAKYMKCAELQAKHLLLIDKLYEAQGKEADVDDAV